LLARQRTLTDTYRHHATPTTSTRTHDLTHDQDTGLSR
ncbi:MAG: hypothetical protein QG671_2265, partial [Actinomycetota bacterium]|nr:hypothetical protein [Actinomycetota bacterium]MDQ1306433.1 hypothetical protein [Actinomycetota bacterium]